MDYIKRQYGGGHPIVKTERIIERVVEKQGQSIQQPIDVNALANALAQIMTTTIAPINGQTYINTEGNKVDTFDNRKTLEELANSMIVQRGNNESNFNNLGNEHHTKTNKEEIAKTIDLLSSLND